MIRNLEIGFPKGTKSYVSAEGAAKAAQQVADKFIRGVCNVRIVKTQDDRWTAIFVNLTDLSDAQFIARAGFMVFN